MSREENQPEYVPPTHREEQEFLEDVLENHRWSSRFRDHKMGTERPWKYVAGIALMHPEGPVMFCPTWLERDSEDPNLQRYTKGLQKEDIIPLKRVLANPDRKRFRKLILYGDVNIEDHIFYEVELGNQLRQIIRVRQNLILPPTYQSQTE